MAYSVDVLTLRITVTFTISNSCMVRERVREFAVGICMHRQLKVALYAMGTEP